MEHKEFSDRLQAVVNNAVNASTSAKMTDITSLVADLSAKAQQVPSSKAPELAEILEDVVSELETALGFIINLAKEDNRE